MHPLDDTRRQGLPCALELSTHDLDASAAFYAAVFGWSYAADVNDEPRVRTALVGGRPAATLRDPRTVSASSAAQSTGSAWTIGFSAINVLQTASRAEGLGATILEPPVVVPGYGQRAVVRDPWGATFALIERMLDDGFAVAHEPGAYDWCDLFTPDGAAAKRFYARLFDAEVRPIDPDDPASPDGFLVVNEQPVAAIFQRDDDPAAHWLPFFEVADADRAAAACLRAGGTVDEPPTDSPFGTIAHLRDPRGAPFAINRVPHKG